MFIYAAIGRYLFLILRPVMQLYFSHQPSKRVRIIVKLDSGKLLLIKGWFSQQLWEMPGGGIKRGELPIYAAVRELHEETGLLVKPEDLKLLGEFKHVDTATPYVVVLYVVNVSTNSLKRSKLRHLEIIDQQEFAVNRLPADINPFVPLALRRLSEFE